MVKGKRTRRPVKHVSITWMQVPEEILNKYGDVTLEIDIMAINKIPFIASTSRNIHFGTSELIHDKTK